VREPPKDVLAFSRIPAGVTGIPRLRDWDAVVVVELPELERSEIGEIEVVAPESGDVLLHADDAVPHHVGERIAAALDEEVDRPYEALAVRQDGLRWSAGARMLRGGTTLDFPAGLPAASLELAVAPDGAVELRADGDIVDPGLSPLFAEAAAELERHGRAKFQFFVARADKVAEGSWQLTMDPL
jgi:hypothetical protein